MPCGVERIRYSHNPLFVLCGHQATVAYSTIRCTKDRFERVLTDQSHEEWFLWRIPKALIAFFLASSHCNCQLNVQIIDRFHCHGTKKLTGNRLVEEAKKIKCYKRLIYKQFVHVSDLCGPQFLSYLPKRFTYLCRALYGDAILVNHFGAPIWLPEINKNIEFTFSIKVLSLPSRTSIRVHRYIF